MEKDIFFYIYGMCTMFYAMMAWVFANHGRERLWRLVTILMALICAQCIKDIFFFEGTAFCSEWAWTVATSMDMVAVPLYTFILIELCAPGKLSWRRIVGEESPFVILPVLLLITRNRTFYDIEVAWAGIYGLYYAIWTFFQIPRYHRQLKEIFSYTENINLHWLRTILCLFIGLIVLWVLDSFLINIEMESIYMLYSMVSWMLICHFLYRHESVMSDLQTTNIKECQEPSEDTVTENEIGVRIKHFIIDEKAYLNPKLKLSDVAAAIGSNRTYVSHWFNKDCNTTFFDYINALRIEHACRLLTTTNDSLEAIAHESGFNSTSTLYRLFAKLKGATPSEYREAAQKENK